MAAMDRVTGKRIDGLEEVEQAIDEILDTIPGDRIMRADYGSELFELTDIGMDATGKARITQAVGEAIRRFEPRVRITQVEFTGTPGALTQTVRGVVRVTNQQITVKR